MDPLMLVILGFVLVLVAAVAEAYCAFGRLARPDVKPRILKGWSRWVMETFWALLLLAGGVCLLIVPGVGWILALAGVVGFWLILPFILTPIIRNRLLPHWDEVKSELAPKGYNDKDYWRGDWWMVEDKQKQKKKK